MSVMHLSLKLSSFHINLDVKRSFVEGSRKLQKAIKAEAAITNAINRKESYLIKYHMNLY